MATPVSTLYEPIMEAVLALLQSQLSTYFPTIRRKFYTWQQIIQDIASGQSIAQPALFMLEGVGLGGGIINYVQAGRTPSRRTLSVTMVIYATQQVSPAGPALDVPGASILWPLVEVVENAFNPSPSDSLGVATLGGLVTHCWVEGDGVIITGDIDPTGQGMATVPVKILIP